jgi:hypothetical protein
MKILLWILPLFLLMPGCKSDRDRDANDNTNDNRTVEETRTDENVNRNTQPDEPDTYIAFREDANGTVYLRDTDEDIDRLIIDLRPLDVEVALLERGYWRDNRCRQMSGRQCVAGDCVVGNCEQVVVAGWTVCRCRP